MQNKAVAHVSTTIDAPVSLVWNALVNPETIKRYMFGTDVNSSWQVGSPISWKGSWQGKPYEDKGVILQIDPGHVLEYTHFSPLSGQPDAPESYHTVTIRLRDDNRRTIVTLDQDNNPTEEARAHSESNWRGMLDGLKKVVTAR